MQNLLRLASLEPDYSTVSRRQQSLQVQLLYRPSKGALDLPIDRTCIKFLGEGEWKCKKYGVGYRRPWRKVHLAIDAQTLEVQAIDVTDSRSGDAYLLSEPQSQTLADEPINSMSVDDVYDDTKACHAASGKRML